MGYLVNFDFDLADVKTSFEPLPADTYEAKIIKQELTKAKQSGNQMIKIEWQIIAGEFTGRKVFDNIVILNDPAKMWKLKQYAALIDICSGQNLDPELFIGCEALIEVTLKELSDEEKAKAESKGWSTDPKNNIKKVTKIG